MEKLKDLKDLLKHEILDLYSAEEQIIEALPAMIEKAGNPALKEALQQHLQVTEEQRTRLERVQQLLMEGEEGGTPVSEEGGEKKRGFISGLFKGKEEKQVCLGTKGLIDEGRKVMEEDMEPEVLDAAIIASAQKIEHYEICGYGTAKAYASELNLTEVAQLLDQTLNEEYDADDRLTDLAVGRVNREAEEADSSGGRRRRPGNNSGSSSSSASKSSSGGRSSSGRGGSSSGGGSKSASKGASKGSSSKSSSKSSSGRGSSTKSASKSSGSKGAASGRGGPSKSSGSSKSATSGKSGSKGASKSIGGGRQSGGGNSNRSKAPGKAAASKGGSKSSGSKGSSSRGNSRGR